MPRLKPIHSWDEVPSFDSDADAATFWEAHEVGEGLVAGVRRGLPANVSAALSSTVPAEPVGTIGKAKVVRTVAERAGITREQAGAALDVIVEEARRHPFRLRGVGIFSVNAPTPGKPATVLSRAARRTRVRPVERRSSE